TGSLAIPEANAVNNNDTKRSGSKRGRAEKNNELLMKNHQNRPTGSLAIPEANAVNNNDTKRSGSKRGRGNIPCFKHKLAATIPTAKF
ncbi:hypothetical protein Tco_0473212, partial [Tanacetum coccineum]